MKPDHEEVHPVYKYELWQRRHIFMANQTAKQEHKRQCTSQYSGLATVGCCVYAPGRILRHTNTPMTFDSLFEKKDVAGGNEEEAGQRQHNIEMLYISLYFVYTSYNLYYSHSVCYHNSRTYTLFIIHCTF